MLFQRHFYKLLFSSHFHFLLHFNVFVMLLQRDATAYAARGGLAWSHRFEHFANNFTADKLKVYARADPNIGDMVQRDQPQNLGGIWVGSWEQKPAISLKRCKIVPRLLWRTNTYEVAYALQICTKINDFGWPWTTETQHHSMNDGHYFAVIFPVI